MSKEEKTPFGVNLTKRIISAGGERQLYQKHHIGYSGSLELVDYMGTDGMVERVATAGHGRNILQYSPSCHSLNIPQSDFLMYLANKKIESPFKSVQIKLGIQSPISTALDFVYAQECSVNEYSGRYSLMLKTAQKVMLEELLQNTDEKRAREIMEAHSHGREQSFRRYLELQNLDMARELSRSVLGIDNDTKYYWKIDLLSLANVTKRLKSSDRTSRETLKYVRLIEDIISQVAPGSWDALTNTLWDSRFDEISMPNDEKIVDGPLSPPSWKPAYTKRVIVPALEEKLFERERLLDHGELQAVDYMGDDRSSAQAARTSYGDGTKKLSDDKALIRTLIRDAHTSPIEMTEIARESKTPIFSDPRQESRHRTLDDEGFMGIVPVGSQYYLAGPEEFKYQDRVNRQGRGKEMDPEDKEKARKIMQETFEDQIRLSRKLRRLGAPEEVVRTSKGVGFYTKRWRTGDTHNWMHYLGLRNDSHAQKEIRTYAQAMDKLISLHTPTAHEAFLTYRKNAMRLSEKEIKLLKKLVASERPLGELDLESVDTYKGAGLVIKKDGKSRLSREGIEFKKKLEKLLEE